ncbi:pyridoxal-dependent decarboxylase [Streptomyces diastatochromogenes]|nr:pyridoxal-dependent decarboxylase [Streptomyces diastatochromogenes]
MAWPEPAGRRTRAASRACAPAGRGRGRRGHLARFAERWAPGFSGSAGPRYLGFVTGGATPASVAGDWLTSTFDQNISGAGGSWAAELERETVAWLRELFGLGEAHSGAFVTGATVSNTVGLAIAREWLGERLGVDVSRSGPPRSARSTCLRQPALQRGQSHVGAGHRPGPAAPVPLLPGNREAVDVAALESALADLGGRPAIVVANAGTVNTVDFDDLRAIAALKERHDFWLHVDAAFGGFAALSPEYAMLVDGLDAADSVCVDLHKWLNVPYDAAVQFTRRRDLQVAVFHNSSPYLGLPTGEPDFLHLTPENSRRLRALPAWFSLVAYGRAGHREIVERNVALARRLGEGVDALPACACWPRSGSTSSASRSPRRSPRRSGWIAGAGGRRVREAFLTPTVYGGVPALRAAFSNWRTTEADTRRVLDVLATASG